MTDLRVPDEIAATVVNPRAHAEDAPVHEAFRWIRANVRSARRQSRAVDPFWVVTRHADILEISRQNDLFHSGDMPTTLHHHRGRRKVREMTGGSPHLVRTLVQMDAPDHPKYRALTQSWFLPQNIRRLEARIREIARAHVDRMAELGGACDFVRDVALTYPLRVIMEVLGVPPEDEPRMLRLTQELFGAADPELNRSRTRARIAATTVSADLQARDRRLLHVLQGITDDREGRSRRATWPRSSPTARSTARRSTTSRR